MVFFRHVRVHAVAVATGAKSAIGSIARRRRGGGGGSISAYRRLACGSPGSTCSPVGLQQGIRQRRARQPRILLGFAV